MKTSEDLNKLYKESGLQSFRCWIRPDRNSSVEDVTNQVYNTIAAYLNDESTPIPHSDLFKKYQ